MAGLRLQIVTPEAQIFDGQVESVTLPGSEGEFGVFPQHNPLLTQLKPGELSYVTKEGVKVMVIGGGFVEVTQTDVRVITDLAMKEPEIDEQVVQDALKRAEEALRSKTLIGEELEATQATIARSVAQLKLKKKHKTGGF